LVGSLKAGALGNRVGIEDEQIRSHAVIGLSRGLMMRDLHQDLRSSTDLNRLIKGLEQPQQVPYPVVSTPPFVLFAPYT
jgi:hypothetical protein